MMSFATPASCYTSQLEKNLRLFGDSELSVVAENFRPLLGANGVSVDGVEWTAFKTDWKSNIQTNIWALLLTHHRSKFPNLSHVVELLLVLLVSIAKVERSFSAMRHIKTDCRSRLNRPLTTCCASASGCGIAWNTEIAFTSLCFSLGLAERPQLGKI